MSLFTVCLVGGSTNPRTTTATVELGPEGGHVVLHTIPALGNRREARGRVLNVKMDPLRLP